MPFPTGLRMSGHIGVSLDICRTSCRSSMVTLTVLRLEFFCLAGHGMGVNQYVGGFAGFDGVFADRFGNTRLQTFQHSAYGCLLDDL